MAEKRHLEEEDISLSGIIQKLGTYKNELFSKWRWLVFGIIPFVIAGWIYAFVTEPVYIARTTFMLETREEKEMVTGHGYSDFQDKGIHQFCSKQEDC